MSNNITKMGFYIHTQQTTALWRFTCTVNTDVPIPVATRPKARVCSFSSAGIKGSNPAGGIDVCC